MDDRETLRGPRQQASPNEIIHTMMHMLDASTDGQAVEHALVRDGFVNAVVAHPELRALYRSWNQTTGTEEMGNAVAARLFQFATALGMDERSQIWELADESGVLHIPVVPGQDEAELLRLREEAQAALKAYEDHLKGLRSLSSPLYEEAFEWFRGRCDRWHWIAFELVSPFALIAYAAATGHTKETEEQRELSILASDWLPEPINGSVSIPAGTSLDDAAKAIEEHIDALRGSLAKYQRPKGSMPKKKTETLIRYGEWAARHYVFDEKPYSIAKSYWPDESPSGRHKDVTRAIDRAATLLDRVPIRTSQGSRRV